MLLERVRNDPDVQATSGKLQATPLGGIPPANTRRSTGPLENVHGVEARKDRFGMYRPVRPLQVTSGKAQVQQPVPSGTGQAPVARRIPLDKVPVRISSGKAQVQQQVPSGTGRAPDKHLHHRSNAGRDLLGTGIVRRGLIRRPRSSWRTTRDDGNVSDKWWTDVTHRNRGRNRGRRN